MKYTVVKIHQHEMIKLTGWMPFREAQKERNELAKAEKAFYWWYTLYTPQEYLKRIQKNS